jgi:hypothetical protein
MTTKQTALASLDIMSEGLAQQDGLAERLTRQRSSKSGSVTRVPTLDSPPSPTSEQGRGDDSISQKTTTMLGGEVRPSFKSQFPTISTSNSAFSPNAGRSNSATLLELQSTSGLKNTPMRSGYRMETCPHEDMSPYWQDPLAATASS